jgi:hypothetical protein
MTGGGGGDDTWRRPAKPVGGGGPPTGDDPCAIDEITTINSPDRTVLGAVRVGDTLALVLEMGPPRRLLAHAAGGRVAGSITSPSLAQIIVCIQAGVAYGLEVLSVRGAVCLVRIFRL